MGTLALILLGVVAVGALWLAGVFNRLVTLQNQVKNAWSQIDVQLKRRNDLIPNLVETTKGYAKHEKSTFEEVANLRNQLVNVPQGNHEEAMKLSNQITDSLKSIFALAEAYPDLKANQNFLKLQEELTNTENKIAYSRQLYNSTVATYDQKLLTFPSNIVAKWHHFTKINYLETPSEEKNVPQVKF